jgi:hypothetical protein
MTRETVRAALLAAIAISAPAAAQIASLTAAELYSACLAYRDNPDTADGRACYGYVRGFLDATARPSAEVSSAESFRERAARTRIGARRTSFERYCLDESVSLEQVVDVLMERRVADPQGTSAATAVHGTLRRLDGCRQVEQRRAFLPTPN